MTIKKIARLFLIVFSLIVLLVCSAWFWFNNNVSGNGAEMADSFLFMLLLLATVYYSSFAVWTYRVYKYEAVKFAGLQLGLIFIFGILTAMAILLRLYLWL